MFVRIRFNKGAHIHKKRGKNRHLALAASALLIPCSLMAAVLGVWRVTTDLGWTSGFAFSSGPLAHWVMWILAAALLFAVALRLNRYGQG